MNNSICQTERMREALETIAFDCKDVGLDETISSAEKRAWMAVSKIAMAALVPSALEQKEEEVTDTMRLDWLENGYSLTVKTPWALIDRHGRITRATIDAAMKANP